MENSWLIKYKPLIHRIVRNQDGQIFRVNFFLAYISSVISREEHTLGIAAATGPM